MGCSSVYTAVSEEAAVSNFRVSVVEVSEEPAASSMKAEAAGSSKTSVNTCQTTRRYISLHHVSITKPNRLMLFRETAAVYCGNNTEHTNTLFAHNEEFFIFYVYIAYEQTFQ
jgi:hypothetical protein